MMNDGYLAPPVPLQSRRKKLHKSTIEIAKMYNDGLTISEIAEARGTSTVAVQKALMKQGLYIPTRYPLTEDEKASIVWKIINNEDTLEGIGIEFNRSVDTILDIVANAGYRKIKGQYVRVRGPLTEEEVKEKALKRKAKRTNNTVKKAQSIGDDKETISIKEPVEDNKKNEETKTMTFQEELNALVLNELMKMEEGREAIERKGMFRIVREIEAAVAELLN